MSREIRSDAVTHGQHAEQESDRFVRCARCGFPCKLDRDVRAPEGSKVGWGIRITAITTGTAAGQATSWGDSEWGDSAWDTGGAVESTLRTLYDPIVIAGCPQCGTYLYNK